MSKYIKLDDVIHNLNMEVTGRIEYTETMKANLFFAIDKIPTLEVSDSADRPFEYFKGYEDGKASVEVSEDAINREYMLRALNGYGKDWQEDCEIAETIRNAPSVIPKAKEGEWKITINQDYRCSNCNKITSSYKANYCPCCGAKMKEKERIKE